MTWRPGYHADTSQGASGHRNEVSKLRKQVVNAMTSGDSVRIVYRAGKHLDALIDVPAAWHDRLKFAVKSGAVLDLNTIVSVENTAN